MSLITWECPRASGIQDQGIYILDSKTRSIPENLRSVLQLIEKESDLVAEAIKVKGNTRYQAEVYLKTRHIVAEPNPVGFGACINITELSDEQFLESHPGIFFRIGSSQKFQKLKFEFRTRKKTSQNNY